MHSPPTSSSTSSSLPDSSSSAGTRPGPGRRPGPGPTTYAVPLHPATVTNGGTTTAGVPSGHCYCHLCTHNGSSHTSKAAIAAAASAAARASSPGHGLEFHYGGPRSPQAPPEDEVGVVAGRDAKGLDGPRSRRPFPTHRQGRRRGSKEEGLERNGILHGSGGGGGGSNSGHGGEGGGGGSNGGSNGTHTPPTRNPSGRRVDFYLGPPNHCPVLGDCTPAFPREWDPCYSSSSPQRWHWPPAMQPCRDHYSCSRDAGRSDWDRSPHLTPPGPPPMAPMPHPCCYPPDRPSHHVGIGHGPHQHQHPSEYRGHLGHGDVIHGGGGGGGCGGCAGLEEPCWECVRDQYLRDRHLRSPELIAAEPAMCSFNGQHHQHHHQPQPHQAHHLQQHHHQQHLQHSPLSPVISYGHMAAYAHPSLSRQTSPEHHGTCNGPLPGQRTFFPTEVSPSKLRVSEDHAPPCRPKLVNGRQTPRRDPEPLSTLSLSLSDRQKGGKGSSKSTGQVDAQQTLGHGTPPATTALEADQKNQSAVREQIRRVVGDLEEVLGGLKQVHLEMREVVEQIDVLTSVIGVDASAEEKSHRQPSHEPLLRQLSHDPLLRQPSHEPLLRQLSHDPLLRQPSHDPLHQPQQQLPPMCQEVKALVHRPPDTLHLQHHHYHHHHRQDPPQPQLQGINGHYTPTSSTPTSTPTAINTTTTATATTPSSSSTTSSSKPSATCHPPVTRRGGHVTPTAVAAGDLLRVKALGPGQRTGSALGSGGHEVARDRDRDRERPKMNGNCVAAWPPRDRVKDAQRRRLELTSIPLASIPLSAPATSHLALPLAAKPANGNAGGGGHYAENHKPPPYPTNHQPNGRVETLQKDPEALLPPLRPAALVGKSRQVSTAV